MPRAGAPRRSRSRTVASVLRAYDYALLRLVPDTPAGDAVTIGVVLQCRQARFLGVRFTRSPDEVARTHPQLHAGLAARYVDAVQAVVAGGAEAAPIGLLPPSERFHWLTAVRSTVLQASAVHTGLTDAPEAALDRIARSLADTAKPPGRGTPSAAAGV